MATPRSRPDPAREGLRRAARAAMLGIPPVGLAVAPFHPEWVPALASVHLALFAPTFIPNNACYGPLVRRGPGDAIYLTFDDGPDPEATPRLLDALDRAGARATFFLVGRRVRRHPDLARAIAARGHAIGNHSDTHESLRFWALGRRGILHELDACSAAIADIAGSPPTLFRAPVGIVSPNLHPALRERGLTPVGWTARAGDVRARDPRPILRRLVPAAAPGAILVMHPEHPDPTGHRASLAALDSLLDAIGPRPCAPLPPDA